MFRNTNMIEQFSLSNAELDVLSCLLHGRNYLGVMEILELSENEFTSCTSSICEKTNSKTTSSFLSYIKQSELESDLVLRYMEIFDTFTQKRFSRDHNKLRYIA